MEVKPEIATLIPAVKVIKMKKTTTITTVDRHDPRTKPSTKEPVCLYAETQKPTVIIVPRHLNSPLIKARMSKIAAIPPAR